MTGLAGTTVQVLGEVERCSSTELLYVKFTRKEQTSLPALVLNGEFRNSYNSIWILLGLWLSRILADTT